MTLAALGQVDAHRSLSVARSMGYGRVAAAEIRVPGNLRADPSAGLRRAGPVPVSVVDVALITGPSTLRPCRRRSCAGCRTPICRCGWSPRPGRYCQLALVIAVLALWRLGECAVAGGDAAGRRPGRARVLDASRPGARTCWPVGVRDLGGLLALTVWSFAGLWRFPDILPDTLTLRSGSALGRFD